MTASLPSVWLNELTWEEVAQYQERDDIIIFPVGSTEQHGPAGPLGLDSYVAISLAEDVAKQAGVLCTPPLWFGDSSHHLAFPGTISLATETLAAIVKDVVRSLAQNGFRKVLIINGHKGANLPALLSATKSLREQELPHVFIAVIDPMKIGRGIASKIKETAEHHAGELEVSQLWYKYPHLVRTDRLTSQVLPHQELFSPFAQEDLMGGGGDVIDVPWTSAEERAFAPSGALSPSAPASPEKGRRYHEYMVENILRFIQWLRQYRGPIASR